MRRSPIRYHFEIRNNPPDRRSRPWQHDPKSETCWPAAHIAPQRVGADRVHLGELQEFLQLAKPQRRPSRQDPAIALFCYESLRDIVLTQGLRIYGKRVNESEQRLYCSVEHFLKKYRYSVSPF